ncbi:uncharacterized protein LOC126738957 isoform X1 [Anthonomus grandis grandis]|uniref:uncharacterized protein LOC126738957 isoform X1 n=1 Tax=Anthonomus grandis grandis TaxID=2921223 RepID=UPI00216587AC|nr:uncharacterized protein LOC126738957 isoform X1 [Anthonomus grandis grandis]
MGGYKCVYLYCSSHSGGGTTLFRFPKDELRSTAWLKAAGREDLSKKNLINYKLCEHHFENKYIYTTTSGLKRLYDNAIPNIFCGSSKRSHRFSLVDEPPKKIIVLTDIRLNVQDQAHNALYSSEKCFKTEVTEEKQTKQEDSEENTFQEQSDFRGECSSKAKLTTSDSFDQASEDSNFEPDETKVIIKEEPLDSDLDEIECKKIKIECESEEDCDEDLLFFKSLLPDFKLLSPEIKRELQGRIQEMVREATLSTTMHNF